MTKDPYSRALAYAYRLLAVKDRTERELRQRLRDKGAGSGEIDRIITGLKGSGLVNDDRFARKWVRESLSLRPRGPLAIRSELLRKGLDAAVIDSALSDPENGYNEYDAAHSLARKSRKSGRSLYGYLARRGFSFDVVNEVLEEHEDRSAEGQVS